MPIGTFVTRLALALALATTAAAVSGCESVREAMGGTKAPPDEFAVITAAPLIVPPDYNLRPPQPGAPSRNLQDPSTQARSALYQTSAQSAEAAMGSTYSDSEKSLLSRSGAANVDPSIRRTISTETGYDANDPTLTDRVLSGGGGGAPAAQTGSTTPAPAPTEPATAPAEPPGELATSPPTE
jgi:hypothetical protein